MNQCAKENCPDTAQYTSIFCVYHNYHEMLSAQLLAAKDQKQIRCLVRLLDKLEATGRQNYNHSVVIPETDSEEEEEEVGINLNLDQTMIGKPERITQLFKRIIEKKPDGTTIVREREERRTVYGKTV